MLPGPEGKGMFGSSQGNYLLGITFIIVSVLFAVDLFHGQMHFSIPLVGRRKRARLVPMLLGSSYPLIGIAFWHILASLILSGTVPCPTTALGLLLLTSALPRIDRAIYILLLLCTFPFTLFF